MRRLPIVQLSSLTCVAALAFVPAASADDLGGPYGRDAGAPPAIDQRVPDAPATALRAAVSPADHRIPDAITEPDAEKSQEPTPEEEPSDEPETPV